MPPGHFLSPKLPLFSTNYSQFATLTHRNNEPVFTTYFYKQLPFLFFILRGVPVWVLFTVQFFLCMSYVRLVFYFVTLYKYSVYLYIYNICVFIFNVHLVFFISNYGQASALKVFNIYKIFGAQRYIMVSQCFHQVSSESCLAICHPRGMCL